MNIVKIKLNQNSSLFLNIILEFRLTQCVHKQNNSAVWDVNF